MLHKIILAAFFSSLLTGLSGQDLKQCSAYLHHDTLTIGNDLIFEHFRWNDGNLVRLALGKTASGKSITAVDDQPAFSTGKKNPVTSGNGTLQVTAQAKTNTTPAYLKVEVICTVDQMQVKRIFRVYPDCPAIAAELYLKGSMEKGAAGSINAADLKNIESEEARRQGEVLNVISDRFRLSGKHWKARAVEFFDVTDRNNNLVQTYDRILYSQECQLRGNLLFLENRLNGDRLFILKEAPTSSVQLNYPGYDFTARFNEVKVAGIGLTAGDISDSTWSRAYGTVTGISDSEAGILTALRIYQHNIRIHKAGRDEMILMNTWGDRGQDTKVNEAFCLAELEAGARLGISHFQLDDGWQTGRSSNSAFKGGSLENIWRNVNYWKPNPQKFPSGLKPVVDKGRELGIEICLWFNPSGDNSNINWEKDADALISLYREYGIRTFKIDGVKLPDKTAEINFRRMLDKVTAATNGEVVFNLDVTAGRRGGYNFLNEYGNIFLENRYTDWQNYYPYWTLRNLWMLSRYVPSRNLQIEFLNKWRNTEKYGNDPFAPGNYSFDYLFAITMAAQPLAWFEATGLPAEAFQTSAVIKKYKQLQNEIHQGIILPVGEEPDGKCWTGFQSMNGQKGFFIIYRESSTDSKALVKTWIQPGTKVKCQPVFGKGKAFTAGVNYKGEIPFEVETANSFELYRYELVK